MRKCAGRMILMGVLTALLLLLSGLAAAEEDIPEQVWQQWSQYGRQREEIADTLAILDGVGNEWFLIVDRWGHMDGYCLREGETWQCWWSGIFLFRAEDIHFERQGQSTCFDIVSVSLDACMRYEGQGEGFSLIGWRDGKTWPGDVEVRESAVVFLPDDGSAPIEIPIGVNLKSWLGDFEYMAKTPEDMRARAAIGKEGAKAAMPGWTMGYYEMFNNGRSANAAYYRVEDRKLTIARLNLESDAGVTYRTESLALPLSPALLEKLESGSAEELLDVSGYGSTFLTEDAWDTAAIPIQGKIIENDLQAHGLLALVEREGKRYIALAEPDENGGWKVRESKPLPEKTWLDLFHSRDDELGVEWMIGDEYCQCGFERLADGTWRMRWAWAEEGDYSLTWYGLRIEFDTIYTGVYAYGTAPFADLFSCDLTALPRSAEEAAAQMDTSGWAMVHNPDPKDRLHLRAEPSKNAHSLGKFYNGTPLRVLEEKGDWVRVRVGVGDVLEGWMMKEYLAFGDALRRVTQAFPDLTTREEVEHRHPLRIDGQGEADFILHGGNSWDRIIGIRQETRQWIVMMEDGRLCLTPMDWFWEGNG